MATITTNTHRNRETSWPPGEGLMFYATLGPRQKKPDDIFMSTGEGKAVSLGTGRIIEPNWGSWAENGVIVPRGHQITLTQE